MGHILIYQINLMKEASKTKITTCEEKYTKLQKNTKIRN